MISVIVPTMWKYPPFLEFFKSLVHIGCIGELIIINNNKQETPNDLIFSHPKVRIHNSESNLYVAPSWNLGANLAQFEHLAFLGDDVFVDINIFRKVDGFLSEDVEDNVGIVGAVFRYDGDDTYQRFYTDGSIDIIYVHEGEDGKRPSAAGMGNLFFIKKKLWKEIPFVKIFHGEVLQWNRLDPIKKNHVVVNCNTDTPWHTTWKNLAETSVDEFNRIQMRDQEYCENVKFYFE
jgi:hypothetical protein